MSGLDFDLRTFDLALPNKAVFRQGGADSSASSVSRNSAGSNKHHVMARHLYKTLSDHQWMEAAEDEDGASLEAFSSYRGVVLQRSRDGSYVTYPPSLNQRVVQAALRLEVPLAVTMSSGVTNALVGIIRPEQQHIGSPQAGLMMPIVDSVTVLAEGRINLPEGTFLCFCKEERLVLIWSDTVDQVVDLCNHVETWLVGLVWGATTPSEESSPAISRRPSQAARSRRASAKRVNSMQQLARSNVQGTYQPPMPSMPVSYVETISHVHDEKYDIIKAAIVREEEGDQAYDPERDGVEAPQRPFCLSHAVCISLAMVLVIVVEFSCVAKLLTEVRLDKSYLRFALLLTVPLFGAFALFFMIVITGSLFQLFGPLSSVQNNSVFYSAKPPKRGRYTDYELPHVTIQMPVYKEGLKGVIMPTIESCMHAVRYYEAQGGTASIFVNDDGMQLITSELAQARQTYYEMNNVGWCSRPKHCTTEGESFFLRKGKFKKASNMNHCLDFAAKVEDAWLLLIEQECQERKCTRDDLSIDEEDDLYDQARKAELKKDGRTWAAGDLRMGEMILIIDSDTRVPQECLLYGALEMHESPEVALLQHASGILQVVNNAFENGITYFTNLIYTSIQFAVGSGDVAPFVGHNTFVRWKAIQKISWQEDGITKFWSDCHVSEDFDVSLRLQIDGFVVRLAAYHNGGFKEGVSLTVYDELARWEKYAYGCNELVFHPLIHWWRRGPITPLFRKFLGSNIKVTSKITIIAYIFTYYAIASAIPLTLANYLIVGWFSDSVDQFYIASWKIFVGMAVVFNVLSPLAFAMLRHRLGQKTFFVSLWETMKWTPMFLLFFGGLSFHLLKALFCHAFSINMEWTTTAKELSDSGFRVGLDRIFRDFWTMYVFLVLPSVGGMIYLAVYAPWGWTITDFAAIVPLANQVGCHALLPFALGLF